MEIVRYQDGPIRYTGFLKYRTDPKEPVVKATVAARSAMPTYDVRGSQYLGNVAQWPAEFAPARAKLFAQLPYTIGGVKVTVSKAAAGDASQDMGPLLTCGVSVVTASKQPGRHWVNVQLIGPDGRARAPYLRNVSAVGGKGSVVIPLALNEQPGAWKVVAREVISGKTAQATFTVP